MDDRDELARVLSRNWRNMHTNEGLGLQRMLADSILSSDWLRERDRKVREETKAGIAEAIEAAYQEGRGWLSTIREEDADIARDWEK